MRQMKYKVIVETNSRNRPKDHELSAAYLIADYYQANIIFLRPSCQHTPDFDINGIKWELKSPLGNSKNTIKNNLHSARKQSTNIILDLRRIKMSYDKTLSNINYYFRSHRSQIRHLIIITKSGEILEVF